MLICISAGAKTHEISPLLALRLEVMTICMLEKETVLETSHCSHLQSPLLLSDAL